MKNILRVSLDDVLEIVRLRDKFKLSWLTISERVGYTPNACSKHYYLYKSPEPKFYISEFHKALKLRNMVATTVSDAYKLAVSMGYSGSMNSFRNRADIKRLPLKGTSVYYNIAVKKIFAEALADPGKSLRDLVWEHFKYYSYSHKLTLLKKISEISYE